MGEASNNYVIKGCCVPISEAPGRCFELLSALKHPWGIWSLCQGGMRGEIPGSQGYVPRAVHAPRGSLQTPTAPEGLGLSPPPAGTGVEPPSCYGAGWVPWSCAVDSLVAGFPSLSVNMWFTHLKCLENSSLNWLIGVISVVVYSLPFSLHMYILCADFFILQ